LCRQEEQEKAKAEKRRRRGVRYRRNVKENNRKDKAEGGKMTIE
jgi:hypothetical protein